MSSMAQDAYDMGLTTSLGGLPKSSLYYYEDDEDSITQAGTNILKLSISKKCAVLHNDIRCVGDYGNIMKFDSLDDCRQFATENLGNYQITNCPLCVESKVFLEKSITTKAQQINDDDYEIM